MSALEARREVLRARARQEAQERRLTVSEAVASPHALLAWSASLEDERRTFERYFAEEVETHE